MVGGRFVKAVIILLAVVLLAGVAVNATMVGKQEQSTNRVSAIPSTMLKVDSVADAITIAFKDESEIAHDDTDTVHSPVDTDTAAKPLTIPVLCYHQILDTDVHPIETTMTQMSLSKFTTQMDYIKDHNYTPITISQLNGYLNNGKSIPSKPVLITFDDGWVDQYWNAVPVLDRYNFKATFFIIGKTLGENLNEVSPGYMSRAKIVDLKKRGYDIGVHSWSHNALLKGSNETDDAFDLRMDKELKYSKEKLEKAIGSKISAFAYPYGSYDKASAKAASGLGYKLGFTTNGCSNAKDAQSSLMLKRYSLSGAISDEKFAQEMESEPFAIASKSPGDMDEVSLTEDPPISIKLSDVSRIYKLYEWKDPVFIAIDWRTVPTTKDLANGNNLFSATGELSKLAPGYHTISLWGNSKDGNHMDSCWMIKITN